MFLAEVVGTIVSPVQIPVLEGRKLLLLRPVTPEGKPTGKTRIGIDRDLDGWYDGDEAALGTDPADAGDGDPKAAVKTIVVGVVDYVERDGRYTYDHTQESPR